MANGGKNNQCNLIAKWAQWIGRSALWSLVQIAGTKITQWQMMWAAAWLGCRLLAAAQLLGRNRCAAEQTSRSRYRCPLCFPRERVVTNAERVFAGRENYLSSSRCVRRKSWLIDTTQRPQPTRYRAKQTAAFEPRVGNTTSVFFSPKVHCF